MSTVKQNLINDLKERKARVAILGLGYVGLPLAVEFARKYPTLGFDIRPARIAEITRLTGKPVIKAIRVKDDADIAAAAQFSTVASLILYDAKAPETLGNALPGGNGHAFDWGLLEGGKRPAFMLAGGLTPENVAEAIRVTGAPVVDVSSGVESAPGVKDIGLIRKFIEAAKAAR